MTARIPHPSGTALAFRGPQRYPRVAHILSTGGLVRDGARLPWSLFVRAVAIVALLLSGRAAAAEPEPPPHLPRYDVDLTIETDQLRPSSASASLDQHHKDPAAISPLTLPALSRPQGDYSSGQDAEMLTSSLARHRARRRHGVVKEGEVARAPEAEVRRAYCRMSLTQITSPHCSSRCRSRSSRGNRSRSSWSANFTCRTSKAAWVTGTA